jgi:GxxExxY protein
VDREVTIPIFYKAEFLTYYRADLIVDEKVLVEVKSTEVLPPYTRRTVGNYLKATPIEVALILHFGPEAKFQRIVCSKK